MAKPYDTISVGVWGSAFSRIFKDLIYKSSIHPLSSKSKTIKDHHRAVSPEVCLTLKQQLLHRSMGQVYPLLSIAYPKQLSNIVVGWLNSFEVRNGKKSAETSFGPSFVFFFRLIKPWLTYGIPHHYNHRSRYIMMIHDISTIKPST